MTLKILNNCILSTIKKLKFSMFTIPYSAEDEIQIWKWNINLIFYIGVWFYKAESGAWIRCGLSTNDRNKSFK